MDNILFNTIAYKNVPDGMTIDDFKLQCGRIKGHKKMRPMSIEDIYNTYKNYACISIQRFSDGYRVTKDDVIKNFNKVIFIDFDYKNVLNNHSFTFDRPEPYLLYQLLVGKLCSIDYFLYSEISIHGNSFHFLFYIENCNENNYHNYYEYIRNVLYNILNELNYEHLALYDELINRNNGDKFMIDPAGKSIYQLAFLTLNNCIINRKCNGHCNFTPETKKTTSSKTTHNTSDFIIKLIGYKKPDTKIYIEHLQRWNLFNSLSRLFEGDNLKLEWYKCCEFIEEYNKHNLQYYKDCPYNVNDWNKRLKGDEYCDKDLLALFGYDIKFVPINNQKEIHISDELLRSLELLLDKNI